MATLLSSLTGDWIPAYAGMTFKSAGMTFKSAGMTLLEQPDDLSVVVHVDRAGRRDLGQARHRHDVAADHHHEFRASGEAHLSHVHDVARGPSAQRRIVRET